MATAHLFILHFHREKPLNNTKQILLIEDNQGDVILIKEALSDMDEVIDLIISEDGFDAKNQLNLLYVNNKLPDLIILDLICQR